MPETKFERSINWSGLTNPASARKQRSAPKQRIERPAPMLFINARSKRNYLQEAPARRVKFAQRNVGRSAFPNTNRVKFPYLQRWDEGAGSPKHNNNNRKAA